MVEQRGFVCPSPTRVPATWSRLIKIKWPTEWMNNDPKGHFWNFLGETSSQILLSLQNPPGDKGQDKDKAFLELGKKSDSQY